MAQIWAIRLGQVCVSDPGNEQERSVHPRHMEKLPRSEPTDLRVNYGFIAERKFGETLLIPEFNCESILALEADTKRETALEHMRERIVAFEGRSQLSGRTLGTHAHNHKDIF